MSSMILKGGTDSTEVALFSRDQLPDVRANDATLSRLEVSGQALRMKTNDNGGKLLYLYVDEDIEKPIKEHCKLEDPILYRFIAMSGRIGFGGVESTTICYEPRKKQRQDAEIPAGTYDAVAYHADYPRKFVEKMVKSRIGEEGVKKVTFPTKIIGMSALGTGLFLLLSIAVAAQFLVLAALSALAGFIGYHGYKNSAEYKFEANRKREVELRYPDFVVKMARRKGVPEARKPS